MPFETLDYLVVAGYVLLMIGVAWAAKVRGQESLDDFFAGGKTCPGGWSACRWWPQPLLLTHRLLSQEL